MQTMGAYHALYLQLDVLVLADAMNKIKEHVWNIINWAQRMSTHCQTVRGMLCLK